MVSGCYYKEVYRFLHITYHYSTCNSSFFVAAYLVFVHFKNVFRQILILKVLTFYFLKVGLSHNPN